MGLTISKKEMWITSDNATHSTYEMACQYVLNAAMLELFHLQPDQQEIVNVITSNIKQVREFLDACDAAEKALFK